MQKQYTFTQIVQALPRNILLDSLNEVTGLNLAGFRDLPNDSECIALEEYIPEVQHALLMGLVLAGEKLPNKNNRQSYELTFSEDEIKEVCYPWMKSLDKLIYEMHASPTDTPYKFGFQFVSKSERDRISALNYQEVPEGLTPTDFPRSEPLKTFFDKEAFLRSLKNRLWDHLDKTYGLSN